jgi:hypothetical protein
MGDLKAILTGVRVAADPTFIPGADPTKNHAIVTVMANRKDRAGNVHTDSLTVHFWGKAANVAANYLGVGKQCNIEGRLQSYVTDSGTVRSDGKRILNRKVEVNALRCELLADSMKEIQATFDTNIAILKSQGRLDPNAQISLVDVLPKKGAMVDFNPALSGQTGKYGHANVWSKDRGFWKSGTAVAGPAGVVDPKDAKIAELMAMNAALKAGQADGEVHPF